MKKFRQIPPRKNGERSSDGMKTLPPARDNKFLRGGRQDPFHHFGVGRGGKIGAVPVRIARRNCAPWRGRLELSHPHISQVRQRNSPASGSCSSARTFPASHRIFQDRLPWPQSRHSDVFWRKSEENRWFPKDREKGMQIPGGFSKPRNELHAMAKILGDVITVELSEFKARA